jgi:diguanylate cyclase (GGDEF)-like protein
MKTHRNKFWNALEDIYHLATLGILLCVGINLAVIFIGLTTPTGSNKYREFALITGLIGTAYVESIYFFNILPKINRHPRWIWLLLFIHALLLSLLFRFEPGDFKPLGLFYLGFMLVGTAVITDRLHTFSFILFLILDFASYFLFMGMKVSPAFSLEVVTIGLFYLTVTETIFSMKKSNRLQVQRLQNINEISKIVSSTLEIHQVIALISSAIQKAIDADTYYVGIIHGHSLRLELLYDDNEFYPPVELDLEKNKKNSISVWIANHNRPLLLDDVQQEITQYEIDPLVFGARKISNSWMGTALEIDKKVLGVISIASYRYKAFTNSDLEYLQTIALHASLAIDNAYHHAEVERQSRIDSLTEALNHNVFLEELQTAAEDAIAINGYLSLIMLDIDYFKQYNDQYGHLIGDKILRSLTVLIKNHIKETDLLGRWGGEEFVIALRHANGQQAIQVAKRIQNTLADLSIPNRDGCPIPPPTVSQGIAVLPLESNTIYDLIDLADQRLYQAKAEGRNKIQPPINIWDSPVSPESPI